MRSAPLPKPSPGEEKGQEDTDLQDVGVDALGGCDVGGCRHCLLLLRQGVLCQGLLGWLLGDVGHVTVQLHHPAQLLQLRGLRIQRPRHTQSTALPGQSQPQPSPVGAAEHSWLCQGSTPRSGMDTQNLQGVPCQGRSSPRLSVPSWSFPSSAIQFRKLFFSFPVLTCPAKGELCVSCLPPLLPNPFHVVQIPITESAFHKELRFTRLL